ncbi:MAG: TadE family protein [Chloroflexota bacterium]
MHTHIRRAKHSGQGQSLVELSISLTVMLLLLSGAVTFGMAFFSYVAMRDAAQEGALYGSFNPYEDSNGNGSYDSLEPVNLAGIRERVRASSTSPVDFSDASVIPDGYITALAVTGNACEGSVGGVTNSVRVTVEYDFPVFMPFVGAIIGGQTIHMTATVADTILEPRCP